MTDKEIFKAELDRLKEETSIGLSEHDNGVETGRMEVINALDRLLNSMEEEPAGDDLEEAAKRYNEEMSWRWEAPRYPHLEAFKAGAQWQRKQMMKDIPVWQKENPREEPFNDGWFVGMDDCIHRNGYKIKLCDLWELPKEQFKV